MATTKTETATAKKDNRVELFVPRLTGSEEVNCFIGVNDKIYILPRGKVSLVPPEVAYEYKRAERAQARADQRKDELIAKAKELANQ